MINTTPVNLISQTAGELKKEVAKVFIGKDDAIHTLVLGLLTGLHVLIEDIPGVGKTTLAKSLAKSGGLRFGRIQFTPDLLPGDILGMTVWSTEKKEFIFKEGAIMSQFILADEINRATARTQSALLEAMQEDAITVDGKTIPLPQPFIVIATQNPVHFSGTFHLPEAQVDRFGMTLSLGYPDSADEVAILDRFQNSRPLEEIKSPTTPETIQQCRETIRNIRVDESVKKFIVQITSATRNNSKIKLGTSPRTSLHLMLASQGEAAMAGREFVIPEDVLEVVKPVLIHRIYLSPEAQMANLTAGQVLDEVLGQIKLPTGTE